MEKLEAYMHKKEMRLKDLFQVIDKDKSGYLSIKEFESGIKRLVGMKKSGSDAELGDLLMASKDELMARFDGGIGDGRGGGRGEGARTKFKRSQTGF